MARETTYKGILGEWRRFIEALLTSGVELGHLGASRELLEQLLARAEEVAERQASLRAAKQEATRELQEILANGQRLLTMLRFGLKQHYGPHSDKLTHFGMQPFRRRRPAAVVEEPAPTAQPAPFEPHR
jgi:hypothetical protein